MVTGQHTDMTGILGPEVDQAGTRLTNTDPDFWLYDMNLTTIVVSNFCQSCQEITNHVSQREDYFQNSQNKNPDRFDFCLQELTG